VRTLIVALAVAAAAWILAIVGLVIAGRRTHAKELALLIPNLLSLLRGLIHDPRVGRFDKFLLVVAVAWVASPIDLIPEFIPVFGPLDDVVVVALILRRLVRHAGPELVSDHWRGDPDLMRKILKLVRAA